MDYPFVEYEKLSNYNYLINIDNDGMMGYIEIDKLNIELPIYHGTSSSILNVAVGHLEGSSLPIGGKNTHSVLAAHRGLPSAELFTNLSKLELGDIFIITVLNRVMTYQVDNIVIVKPSDISHLQIIEDKDYVTLLTCTPYGLNYHRLLVRGTRIETNEEKNIIVTSEADYMKATNELIVILIQRILKAYNIDKNLVQILYVIIKPVKKINYDINYL